MENNKTLKADNEKKIIIIMRHGEREDDTSFNKEINNNNNTNNDPFLTEKGKLQAYIIGEKLKHKLQNYLNKNISDLKIHLLSSPFIRTIMTSVYLLNGLYKDKEKDKEKETFIEINYGLYEFINGKHFLEDPEDFLIFNNTNEFKKLNFVLYFHIKNENINKENKPIYPEELNSCIKRYENEIKKLKENFEKSDNDILILITHGYGVQVICDFLQINEEEIFHIDYCYTYIFSLITKEYKFLEKLQP
jgi:broad specificity phosphatase PhoE